jgi:hypothetical protein
MIGATEMPKTSDRRRQWRLHIAWPAIDRHAWIQNTAPNDSFEPPGYGSLLRQPSLATIERAYGRYLSYLESSGQLLIEETPTDRVTPGRVANYIRHLEELGYMS